MTCIFNRRYENAEDRKKVINKVEQVMNKDAFPFYKEKFYASNDECADESVMKKLFTDYKLLNQVLENFKSFCPILKPSIVPNSTNNYDKKNRLIDVALKTISWNKVNSEIYEMLETHGDVFFYIYFDDEEVESGGTKYHIPKISLLKSENMINILKNDANVSTAYIYEEAINQEVLDLKTGKVEEVEVGEATYIFKEGEVLRYLDDKKESGVMSVDDKGILNIKSQKNAKSYADMIPIVHISGNKRQDEKFSIIPAQDYVEICLHLMQIQSDIRATNRQLGFPRVTLVDCEYVQGDGRIGGVRQAVTVVGDKLLDSMMTNSIKGQVIQHESATNESFFREEDRVIDYLYNLVGVTNPTLMQRVGSSDSSKVIQQVNARMERKIERYVDSIIEAFVTYFKILLLENGLYDDTESNLSFEKPRSIIRNSAYDDTVLDTMELNSGLATLRGKLKEKGMTDEEIEEHFKDLNKEVVGKDDVVISKEVEKTVKNANSQGGENADGVIEETKE